MDQRVREFERLARLGDEEALIRWLREQGRTGALSDDGLRLAAYLGYTPAAALIDPPLEIPSHREAWLRGLNDREAIVRALIAAAEVALSVWEDGARCRGVEIDGALVPIDKPCELGRGSGCDLRVFDVAVSRRHCALEPDPQGPGLLVTDLESSGGTWINEAQVVAPLTPAGEGARLRVGGALLRVRGGEPSPWLRQQVASLRRWLGAPDAPVEISAAPHEPGLSPRDALAADVVRAVAATVRTSDPRPEVATLTPVSTPALKAAVRAALVPWLLDPNPVSLTEGHEPLDETAGLRDLGIGDVLFDQAQGRMIRPLFTVGGVAAGELERLAWLTQLQHPNLAEVVRLEPIGGAVLLAQEVVAGRELPCWNREADRSLRQRVSLIRKLCSALSVVHDAGRCHGYLTPASVVVSWDEDPVVVDLGHVDLLTLAGDGATGRGQISYMAPERLDDVRNAAPTVDVYALGALLYRLVTGRPPVLEQPRLIDTVRAIRDQPPAPPRDVSAEVPPYLEGVLLRALAKDPARRYPTCLELARALEQPEALGEGA